jgi:hypothetical protein
VSINKAVIHDLGYRRYHGPRRPQSTRYRVIVRNLLGSAWPGWWRYKIPLIGCTLLAFVVGAIMFASRHEMVEATGASEVVVPFADSMLVRSFGWFGNWAFIIALTILAGTLSKDFKAGAFEFYFARPVRPIDYTLGKVVGGWLLMLPVVLIGPLLLSIFRLALYEPDEMVNALPWVGLSVVSGTVAALAYGVVPLAFGAMTRKPRNAIAVYAAFTIVFSMVIHGVAFAMKDPDIAAWHLGTAVDAFAVRLFDSDFISESMLPSMNMAITSITTHVLAAFGFIYWRVRAAEKAGLGGG